MRTPDRIRNANDEAAVSSGVEVTVNTAVVAAPANPDRMYFTITPLVRGLFLRLMPASIDNAERKGIPLIAGLPYKMPVDTIYTGEISVINKKNNEKPIFYVTEF